MAGKQTFTYYLTIDIEAMNDESAMKKLEAWVEPTLALKKNADLNLSAIEYDEPEEEEGGEGLEEDGRRRGAGVPRHGRHQRRR